VLRDGVYLLPYTEEHEEALRELAVQVRPKYLTFFFFFSFFFFYSIFFSYTICSLCFSSFLYLYLFFIIFSQHYLPNLSLSFFHRVVIESERFTNPPERQAYFTKVRVEQSQRHEKRENLIFTMMDVMKENPYLLTSAAVKKTSNELLQLEKLEQGRNE
jgi:hypothetical protein